jgi:hypothetical protein
MALAAAVADLWQIDAVSISLALKLGAYAAR